MSESPTEVRGVTFLPYICIIYTAASVQFMVLRLFFADSPYNLCMMMFVVLRPIPKHGDAAGLFQITPHDENPANGWQLRASVTDL